MSKSYRFAPKNAQSTRSLKAMIFTVLSLFYFLTPANAQLIYGLSGNALISFNANAPALILSNNTISGVAANHTLVGMDSRPATGQLYALGYNQTSGEAQLYTLNPSTGAATAIGATSMLAANLGRVGFDFNPTVDRIRVTGSNNANYRLHPVTGALAATDGSLAFAAGDVNAGMNPSIGAVAYTNSYIGATATTLYNYDDSLNILTSQIPPNNGTLNTIGATGIILNLADLTGDLDIFFDSETNSNIAFLCANVLGTFDALYTIDLSAGIATSIGLIGAGMPVDDIAAFIDRSVPDEITGQLMYALTSNNNLISFDSDMPSIIRTSAAVTGVVAGQVLAGMDSRPATGQLYALGYNSTTGEAQLYTLNLLTGAATMVGTAATLAPNMGRIGFDFNPTVDRIRVTGSNNANYRLHPVTGALAATDGSLAFAAGDVNDGMNPSIGAVAYTNSYIGATATTLYNYDDSLNILTSQIPPNNGTLNTIGATGIVLNLGDLTGDLDIFFDSETSSNIAYLNANVGAFDAFYTIDLATGLATSAGLIGNGISVNDIAAIIDRSVPSEVTGQLIYGLTSNNNLIAFDSEIPSIIRSSVAVTGIVAGQVLSGMDSRPATGQLYALGYNQTTGEAQLYTINPMSGVATSIGTAVTLVANMGRIGFDFNPTVDRIRVTGSNNSNFRLNPNNGAIAATDGTLAFAAGDINNGMNPSIGAVAYTNSYIGASATTLYNYDDSLNVLTSQIPPNNGTLNTIGATGIVLNLGDLTGDLDIFFDSETSSNIAFLNANVASFDALYTVNLATGLATSAGLIGNGISVNDITASIERNVPAEVNGQLVYALTSNNNLVSFDSEAPQIIRASVALTGIVTGQTWAGMDFRPATGELYGLGYNSTTGEAQLYVIDPQNGAANSVGAVSMLDLGTGDIGFDFNPTVDRIRVVGANNNNYRLHPVTGALAATDGSLAFAAGDVNFGADPLVGAVAYTNSFNGSTATTLYNYESLLNIITTQIPPNNGVLNTIGLSGITLNPADASADLDIYFDLLASANLAYLCANPLGTSNDNFYTLSLATGSANLVGRIGNGIATRDIAVLIDSVVVIVGIEDIALTVSGFSAYPNPASTVTYLGFDLDQATEVQLIATDATGRRVATIFNGNLPSGKFETDWNIENSLPVGLYFVHLYTGNALRASTKVIVKR